MCKKKNIFPSCISRSRRPLFFEQFAKFEFLKNISYLCYFSSHSLLFENESRNSLIGKWNSPYKYFSFNDFFYIRFFPWQNFLVIVGKSIFSPLLNFWIFRFSKEKIMGFFFLIKSSSWIKSGPRFLFLRSRLKSWFSDVFSPRSLYKRYAWNT